VAEPAPTHYQQLGVSPSASTATIREAYLRLARLLHPDQAATVSAAERRLAERRMREVNAAWAVLRDPERRRAYDRTLDVAGPRPSDPPRRPPDPMDHADVRWDDVDDLDDDEVDDGVHLPLFVSRLPWLLLAAVAAVIFVFTAYAKAPADPATTTTPPPGACVDQGLTGSC